MVCANLLLPVCGNCGFLESEIVLKMKWNGMELCTVNIGWQCCLEVLCTESKL